MQVEVVEWDYTQRYPIEGSGNTVEDASIVDDEGKPATAKAVGLNSNGNPVFHADVTARGAITVAM